MAPLILGETVLSNGVMLAPMAGVTDPSFRAICYRAGAECTVSEMISAKALCYEQKGRGSAPARTAGLATVRKSDGPMVIQLFGSEPEFMREAALLIESGAYRDNESEAAPIAIDLNMGCPVAKVVSNHEGSALMREPLRAAAIVRAVKEAVHLPVTVKMRAGWDEHSRNAVDFAKRMEEAGADLVTVHGRTRQQFYAPSSDNGIIADVKRAVKIPVVGNGDLFSIDDVRHMIEDTGCDGVMIARGALGNPFLFTELISFFKGIPYQAPTLRERLDTALLHAADLVRRKGERIGIAEARKHMAWYTKGVRGSAEARDTLMHAEHVEDLARVFDALCAMEAEA
ncbi:MAG: tRNA dihydrouridine synthase DusB [Ruminococcaceae bacterium]|nr:tRNA dihydrouridine synthase DusB [Oscillospiraceae bacterium]